MYTAFLPAERASDDEVLRQHRKLSALPYVRDLLDAMPNMAVVLNTDRQIVLFNRAFAEFLTGVGPEMARAIVPAYSESETAAAVIGLRPGEALNCVHACVTEGGCGTTPFCRNCGAANAIATSQRFHSRDVQDCRLSCGDAETGFGALDLRVWAQAFPVEGETFTIFSLLDVSHEKRREALERIFFHDVINTAGGVRELARMLADHSLAGGEARRTAGLMATSIDQLYDEIEAQRDLSAAESGDLRVAEELLHSDLLASHLIEMVRTNKLARERTIRAADTIESVAFRSDPALLRRVLLNLVKNALEAEPAGGAVTLGARRDGDSVVFTVHNTREMPREVQVHVFQRSFSTKGVGRGLGTYSIRLLTERYLRGKVHFVSSLEEGTLFTVQLPLRLAVAERDSAAIAG